jgi:hypothetical protein
MSVFWEGMGRKLKNPLKIDQSSAQILEIKPL